MPLRILMILALSVLSPSAQSQTYELISADEVQSFIAGVWESHPEDATSFPDGGYDCAQNPVKIREIASRFSIEVGERKSVTEIAPQQGSEVIMNLEAIFERAGSYSVFMAHQNLAFVTLPDSAPTEIDRHQFAPDEEPEITTIRKVVRLIRCVESDKVS